MALLFEWEPRKAAVNLRKHGVAFDEALTVFDDPLGRIVDDPDHSVDEHRELIVGRSNLRRLMVVGFTERARSVRLIFARPLTRAEVRDYEENP